MSPIQRVNEFENECFIVSDEKLFCRACREDLSLKKSIITLHIKSEKHTKGKEKLDDSNDQGRAIVQAIRRYDETVHPVGKTLPEEQRVYRVKIVTSFMKAGVPINKLNHFRDILEENGYRLTGRRPMADLIPLILAKEKHDISQEIHGRDVSVIFDGTSRLGEVMVMVLRFIDDEGKPQQRIVRLQFLAKTMSGARELITVLSTELSINARPSGI